MKIIEHGKGLSVCTHMGDGWDAALANALACLGVSASIADERAIIADMALGNGVWHSGYLLTPGRVW